MPFNISEQQAEHLAQQQNAGNQRVVEKTTAALLLLLQDMINEVTYRIKIGQHPIPISAKYKWEQNLLRAQMQLGRIAALQGYNFGADLMTSLGRQLHDITEDGMEAGFLFATVDPYFEEASKRQAYTFTRKVESAVERNTALLGAESGVPGVTAATLASAVLLDMTAFKHTYAEMASLGGMMWANNRGATAAYLKGGIVKWKWKTRGDNKVCPFCAELDGTVRDTSSYFVAANERFPAPSMSAAGEAVTVYLHAPKWNIQWPPLHVRCRCVCLPYA